MKTLLFTLTLLYMGLTVYAQAPAPLRGVRVAIISTMGFERVELMGPKQALEQAGATVHVLTPDGKPIRAFEVPEWADNVKADGSLATAKPEDYDALYVPGGIINPDLLRLDPNAIRFVQHFFQAGKPVGSMCHGPSVLITAGVVRGKRIASWPSIKQDLINAGATYVDEPVVRDGNLVTSRNPNDIPQLNQALIKHFARHEQRTGTR